MQLCSVIPSNTFLQRAFTEDLISVHFQVIEKKNFLRASVKTMWTNPALTHFKGTSRTLANCAPSDILIGSTFSFNEECREIDFCNMYSLDKYLLSAYYVTHVVLE